MSVSKRQMQDASLRGQVLSRYRSLEQTISQISAGLRMTPHTVSAILHEELTDSEWLRLRGANHSRPKTEESNPMFGRRCAAERILRNGRAAVWNGTGYTFEHRLIAAKMLGLSDLPSHLEVHHIDGDKTNNSPDNLAVTTKAGHQHLHKRVLGRLYAWEKEKFGTSVLTEMQATLRKA
jgi:hypothetical protein